MKLRIKTANPVGLKQAIIRMIKDGKLNTWTILPHDGIQYLRHTQQWAIKALLSRRKINSQQPWKLKL